MTSSQQQLATSKQRTGGRVNILLARLHTLARHLLPLLPGEQNRPATAHNTLVYTHMGMK